MILQSIQLGLGKSHTAIDRPNVMGKRQRALSAGNTTLKRNKQQNDTVLQQSQTSQFMDEIINSVASQSASQSADCSFNSTTTAEIGLLRSQMDILSELVRKQHDQISSLSSKLSFLLSMFGLTEDEISSPTISQPSVSTIGTEQNGVPSTVPTIEHFPALSQTVEKAAHSTNYLDAVRRKPAAVAAFRTAVAKAVYVENKTTQNRARNVVVSGLKYIEGQSDRERISSLCKHELSIHPDITACRRLGQRIDGKIQPLLVTVSTSDQASRIIEFAKYLRQSDDDTVRNCVYINAHHTKAESQAAYEMRCLRRAARSEGRVWTAVGRSVGHRVENRNGYRATPTDSVQQLLQPETASMVTAPLIDATAPRPADLGLTVHHAGLTSTSSPAGRLD